MIFTLHPPKPMTTEQETRLAWALLELELAAPMPEPEAWATEEIELVEVDG